MAPAPPPKFSLPPLLVLAPIAPSATGNGLAMRVAGFVEAASATHAVQVAVVPVAGVARGAPTTVAAVTVVARPEVRRLRQQLTELIGDPEWRQLLGDVEPMPPLARAAPVALAPDVIAATGAVPGTPVHVVRSYLAPLGLAVAHRLGSPWTSLDLDDDDEEMAGGDDDSACAYHRLVATFAPRFSLVCLASPSDAEAVGRRHGIPAVTVVNAVPVPAALSPRRPRSDTILFVGNLTYGPNVAAAAVLVDGLLPALQAVVGRPLHVVLVGDHVPGGPVAALAARPSVTVTGFVEDLAPLYGQADVVVAPLVAGSGTRIKLLEAFAHGVPVVTTPVGAAGLAVHHREHLLIGTTLGELVAATAAILDDPSRSAALVSAAFEFVRRYHAPEVQARQVQSLLCAAAGIGDVAP